MEFIWNDGGRSACGFVGMTGDCVTRAVSIATGAVYRDVYAKLGEAALKTPRTGLPVRVADTYLNDLGWTKHTVAQPFTEIGLPKGIVVVYCAQERQTKGHMCCVIEHVVHDTWNASEDADDYQIYTYWVPPLNATQPGISTVGTRPQSQGQELNQQAFEKILRRLRALDNTASNSASTEGEKHNALRMMQDLMLRHNLTRDDIANDDDVGGVQFTKQACPLNSRRACTWHVLLAGYVTRNIFPTVQYYTATRGHRTLFWFFGPRCDVENLLALFKELMLTIATSATLRYGSFARGSGASYAEGYVMGLPRGNSSEEQIQSNDNQPSTLVSEGSLIQTRMLTIQKAADEWLELECGVRLVSSRRSGRWQHDPLAAKHGQKDGASHQITHPNTPKRLT